MWNRGAGILWFFTLLGGAIPLVVTIRHLLDGTRFSLLDVPLWPASLLLIQFKFAGFLDAFMFAIACLLNIALYSTVGWLLSRFFRQFRP